jgi:enoyl-[acyl-carrier protein] reductase III
MGKYFDGQWALVLGASSGFGAAACRSLAKAGMNIIGVHLDRKSTMPQVETLKSELQAAGAKILFFNINAAPKESRETVIKALKEQEIDGIHVLMHSLAFGALKPFIAQNDSEQISTAQVEMTLDVMANSLIYWSQDLNRAGLLSKGGRIFAMTSAGSSRVWKSYGAVSAAKASLESYCRQLALELAPQEITVNALLAGVTDTAALRKIPGNEEMIKTAQGRNPFGRLTTPEDVADAMVILSLPGARFITGNTIRVDGGENVVD